MQLNSAKIDLEILASGRKVPIKIIQPIGQFGRHKDNGDELRGAS